MLSLFSWLLCFCYKLRVLELRNLMSNSQAKNIPFPVELDRELKTYWLISCFLSSVIWKKKKKSVTHGAWTPYNNLWEIICFYPTPAQSRKLDAHHRQLCLFSVLLRNGYSRKNFVRQWRKEREEEVSFTYNISFKQIHSRPSLFRCLKYFLHPSGSASIFH